MDLSRLRPRHLGAILVALTALVYLPHIGNEFVTLDDRILITRNPLILRLTPWTLRMIFTTYDPELYVPLTLFTYQIEHLIFGLAPQIYHFTNLLLHIGGAILVFHVMRKIFRSDLTGFVSALLFAIHPLQSEAVFWAAARKDVLSGFFFLLSLFFYVQHRSNDEPRTYRLSVGSFLLALLAKVSVIMLPLILLLLDWKEGRNMKDMIHEKIPYFILSILFGVIAMIGKTNSIASTDALTLFLLAEKSTVFYLWKMFWPATLSVMYPQTTVVSFWSEDFLLASAASVLLTLGWIVALRRNRTIAFGLGFFLLMLLPNYTNFLKNGHLFFASDRYAYLASVGIFTLLGLAIARLAKLRISQNIGIPVLVLLSVLLGMRTYAQGAAWRNSESLYRNVLKWYPDAAVAKNNFGEVLMMNGKAAEALPWLEEAVKGEPDMMQAHVNLGNALRELGQYDRAIAEYRMHIRLSESKKEIGPEDLAGYYFLGELLEQMGHHDESLRLFVRATEREPAFAESFFNLGLQHQKNGRTGEAVTAFERAVSIDPLYLRAHYHLAGVYAESGRLADAERELKLSLNLDPSNTKAREHLEKIRQLKQ